MVVHQKHGDKEDLPDQQEESKGEVGLKTEKETDEKILSKDSSA